MSKLPKENKFIDLSDFGRPIAKRIAASLQHTKFTPIHVTLLFTVSGLLAISCIIYSYYWMAGFFLILKSILDAADGELARIKNTPSYTGRFLDSIADIILNFLLILTIFYTTNGNLFFAILAFISIQIQGTLYNYYYVILRNKHNGDTTSRIFENSIPKALPGERQKHVTLLYKIYKFCYGSFDAIIYRLDKNAARSPYFPNWFMTAVSTFGLGFQLLVISILLVLNLATLIIPFFIFNSIFILIFIATRKLIHQKYAKS